MTIVQVQEQKQLPAVATFLAPARLPASVEVEARAKMMEIVVKMQAANALPRDEVAIEAYLIEKAKDPVFAEKAVYAKPINKDATEFIYGKSTFLADAMVVCFPHVRVKEIEHGAVDGEDQIEVQAWDFQKDIERHGTQKVSRERWSKGGATYIEKNPDKHHIYVRSCLSKLKRDIIFKVLDPGISERVYEACRHSLDQELIRQEKQKDKYFRDYAKKLEVTPDALLKFLGLEDIDKVKGPHLRRLHAIFSAIANNYIEASDVFEGAKDLDAETKKEAKGKTKLAAPQAPPPEAEKTEEKPPEEVKAPSGESSNSSASPETVSQEPANSSSESKSTPEATETKDSDDSKTSPESSESKDPEPPPLKEVNKEETKKKLKF